MNSLQTEMTKDAKRKKNWAESENERISIFIYLYELRKNIGFPCFSLSSMISHFFIQILAFRLRKYGCIVWKWSSWFKYCKNGVATEIKRTKLNIRMHKR